VTDNNVLQRTGAARPPPNTRSLAGQRTVDQKERELLADLHGRVKGRTFHERDILALLILLRPRAVARSPVLELADFVAHRDRDRGLSQKAVAGLRTFLHGAGNRKLTVAPVFTAAAFCSSLNATFQGYQLDSLDAEKSTDVLAAAISLLQDVQLLDQGQRMGRLAMARTKHDLHLLGLAHLAQGRERPIEVGITILSVPNRYCSGPARDTPEPFDGIVEARCTGRTLRLYVNGVIAG